jgi:hypothetical protein
MVLLMIKSDLLEIARVVFFVGDAKRDPAHIGVPASRGGRGDQN